MAELNEKQKVFVEGLQKSIDDNTFAPETLNPLQLRAVNKLIKSKVLKSKPLDEIYKERTKADISAKKSPIVNIKRFDKPSEYFNEVSKYKFVLCPSGNGVDTHRLWESQILNSLPILLNSNFSSNLKNLRLPALYLDSWDELISFSKTDLDKIYEEKINNNNHLIYLDYWKKIIEEKKL